MPEQIKKSQFTTFLLAFASSASALLAVSPAALADTGWDCKASAEGRWECQPKPERASQNQTARPATAASARNDHTQAHQIGITAGRRLDWVPREALPLDLREALPPYCHGAYVEPDYFAAELRGLDPATQPVLLSGAQSNGTWIHPVLEGDVEVRQGYRLITGERAELDREAGLARAQGASVYREPGILLIGENAEVELDSKAASLSDAEFLAHAAEMRGTAVTLYRDPEGVIHVTRGQLTRCEPGVNTWMLSGRKIKLDTEAGIGTATHATIKVKGVPVIYTPYIQFPLDDRRKSGFLFPQLGSSDNGIDFAAPYYFNLAPNYDATLTPRLISDRGTMAEGEFRYLYDSASMLGRGAGTLGGAYLPGDKEYNDEDRWLAELSHNGRLFGAIHTSVNYAGVSDERYFSDLGTDLEATSQTYLLRQAGAAYTARYWNTSVRVQDFQTLDILAPEPYRRLPEVNFEFFVPHEATGLELGLDSEYVYFDRNNDKLTGMARVLGERLSLTPSLAWNLERAYGFLKPQVQYKHIGYALKDLDSAFDDKPEVGVPVYSLDGGLFFERDISLFKQSMVQTFEPRIYYLKVPYEDQSDLPNFGTSLLTFSYNQLFRDERFIGGDRIGDTEQVSVGLTTRFLEDSGFERFRFSLGQIFYAEERQVVLGPLRQDDLTAQSAYAAEFLFALQSGWRMFGNLEWNPNRTDNDSRVNEGSINLRYRRDDRHIFNLGYRIRNDRREIEQSDVSLIWPLSGSWSLFARWNHDLINDREVEVLAGLEYESCCWSIRVAGRRWINDDDPFILDDVETKQGIYLQLQLKGLAGLGQSLEGIIRNSITGYQGQSNNEPYYR